MTTAREDLQLPSLEAVLVLKKKMSLCAFCQIYQQASCVGSAVKDQPWIPSLLQGS